MNYTMVQKIITINGTKFVCDNKIDESEYGVVIEAWREYPNVDDFLFQMHEYGLYIYKLEEVEILTI